MELLRMSRTNLSGPIDLKEITVPDLSPAKNQRLELRFEFDLDDALKSDQEVSLEFDCQASANGVQWYHLCGVKHTFGPGWRDPKAALFMTMDAPPPGSALRTTYRSVGKAVDVGFVITASLRFTKATPEPRSSSPTYDNATNATTSGSSTTFSHTTGSGANRVMYVAIVEDTTSDINPSGDYAGNTFSVISEPGAGKYYLGIMRAIAPASGSNTVTVNGLGSLGDGNNIIAITYTATDQTTPNATPVVASGTAASVNDSIASSSGNTVVDFLAVNNSDTGNVTPDGSQAQRMEGAGGGDTYGGCSEKAGAASVAMQWSWTSGSELYSHCLLNLNAVGGRTTKNTRSWNLGVQNGMGFTLPA